jgi:hypothetical protein
MCPAVIFAANRNDKVIGRTRTLVVSIITRNGFSHSGAPSGKKWAVDFLGENLKLEINILIHIGKPMHSVIIKCLDDEGQYGTIPIKFIKIIKINKFIIMDDRPFKRREEVRNNCSIINWIIGEIKLDLRNGDFHIVSWIDATASIFIKINIVHVGVKNLNLAGSKIEKMSLIIKIWLGHL